MILCLSTIVMLVLFGGLVAIERKGAVREKEALGKLREGVADLAATAKVRYQAQYGRDPTVEVPTYRASSSAAKK